MKKFSLRESSVLADSDCLIYSSILAKLYMDSAEAHLICVADNNDVKHFIWCDNQIKPQCYCLAFLGEDMQNINDFKIIKEIEANEVFLWNGTAYYLDKAENEHLTIRHIKVFSSQKIVEQASLYEDYPEPVEDISLINFYRVGQGKRYVATGWGVYRKSLILYLPIFEEDEDLFASGLCRSESDQNFPLMKQEIGPGTKFIHGKHAYVVNRDDEGLYISKINPFRYNFKGSSSARLSSDKETGKKENKTKKKALIIPLKLQ